jgi:hypothetical protein
MNEQLAAALAAEEAAIYAYGVLGVWLDEKGDRKEARAGEEVHRARRDTLVERLSALKASPSTSPAGYTLPFEVSDRESAIKLAIHIEDGVAQAWRPLLPVTTGGERSTALSALTDAAVRATRWRRLGNVTPATLPWPGKPETT